MRPYAEGEMFSRVRPLDVETIRIGRNRRVTIRCTEEEQQFGSRRDLNAADVYLLSGPSPPGDDGGVETQHFFDRRRNQFWITADRLPKVAVGE